MDEPVKGTLGGLLGARTDTSEKWLVLCISVTPAVLYGV